MYTSIDLPSAPEFAVRFGQIFEFWFPYHFWNSGIHPHTRFDLCIQIHKLIEESVIEKVIKEIKTTS